MRDCGPVYLHSHIWAMHSYIFILPSLSSFCSSHAQMHMDFLSH